MGGLVSGQDVHDRLDFGQLRQLDHASRQVSRPRPGRPGNRLWEGRSAVFFLEFLPRCRITCIDTFEGGAEHADFDQTVVSSIEARFDSNLASYGQRVRKIKSRSLPALDRLAQDNEAFDLIYIDGSHMRDDVLLNSVLAWRLLAPDGICIWDDYSGACAIEPMRNVRVRLSMHSWTCILPSCGFCTPDPRSSRKNVRPLLRQDMTPPPIRARRQT